MKNWRYVGIVSFLVIGLTVNAVYAGPAGATPERSWLRTTAKSEKSPSRPTDLSVGKWAALLLLVGLGGFTLWKRRGASGRTPTSNVSTMRIIAATRLSSKAQVVALSVQGRTLLLGATDTNITRLGWLDDEAEKRVDNDEDESEDETNAAGVPTRSTLARTAQSKSPVRGERVTPVTTGKKTAGRADLRKPSRFRELLADAMGLTPQHALARGPVAAAPVDELAAAAAEDRYVGQDASRIHAQRMRRESIDSVSLIDIEGQAKGLVARLNRPST